MELNGRHILFTLIKLKSFLMSMIEEQEDGVYDFSLTEEFLERRYGGDKDEFIKILVSNGINSDADIAFDQKIHLKFQEISDNLEGKQSLEEMLDEFEIESHIDVRDKIKSSLKSEREERLRAIVRKLLKLARAWSTHSEIESTVDDYTKLTDEEMLRPDEEKDLDILNEKTASSFSVISFLTSKYLQLFTDYYFSYGGNIPLENFIKDLDDLKMLVEQKYSDLFKKHGLDPIILTDSEDEKK